VTTRAGIGPERGDGIGIEVTFGVLRGVRLDAATPGRVTAAAEVAVADRHDDRAVVDALVRLRAELGDAHLPTRLAVFPTGSTLSRVDATGLSGADLNALRADVAASRRASSTVLVDDGPRRWLVGVAWDDNEIRRLEELTERAGFVDVAVDPSPLALARVLRDSITHVRRNAATDQSFGAVIAGGVVVAAAALDAVGRTSPDLASSDAPWSASWFDDIDEPQDLVVQVQRLLEDAPPVDAALTLAGEDYPEYPPHDLRAPQRQCVALGAAVGAAGLAGRLRPVDMLLPVVSTATAIERPWAIERVSNLPAPPRPTIGPGKRFVARLLPRRR
jgi:hypothetical protein